MASVDVIINTIDKGSEKAQSFGQKVGSAWKDMATPLNQTFELLNKVEAGVGAVFDAFEQGAAMSRAESQFENLAESIDSTADALLVRLKDATKGMMSDADLIAQAGQIMSLGLGKTEDDVVRLATVVGELGWDMNQTILTLANNSKMRLDALGLSIEDVDAKTEKFIAQGKSMDEAFDLAVLEAGEEKIALLGSAADTAAGKLKMVKTAVENMQNAFIQGAAEGFADSISGDELADGLGDAADDAERLGTAIGELVAGAMPVAVAMAEKIADYLSQIGESVSFEQDLQALVDAGLMTEAGRKHARNMWIGIDDGFTGTAPEAKAAVEKMVATMLTALDEATTQADLWEKAQEMMFRGGDNSNYATTEAGKEAGESYWEAFAKSVGEAGTVKALPDALVRMNLDAISEAEALAQEQAEAYAEALEEQMAAQMARMAETGDTFSTAFADFMDPDTAIDFNQVLYDSADAAGASAGALAALKIATGELTEEQARAVLQQAAMIDYAEQLGEAMVSGGLSADDAVTMLMDFQTALEEGAGNISPEFTITPEVHWEVTDDMINQGFSRTVADMMGGGEDASNMTLPVEAALAQESVNVAINEATGMIEAVPLEQRQFLLEVNPDNAVDSINIFVSGTLEPLVSTPYTTTIEADVSAALANVEALISTISRVPRKVNTVFTATVDDSVQNAINAVGG